MLPNNYWRKGLVFMGITTVVVGIVAVISGTIGWGWVPLMLVGSFEFGVGMSINK